MAAVEGNVGLAFALVIAAGLCTCLGATMVLCTNLANHRVLSGALGASAGVMIFVSFAEIFTAKAVTSFVEAGLSDKEAMRYATFAFFTGVVATWLLSKLVHGLAHLAQFLNKRKERQAAVADVPAVSTEAATVPAALPPSAAAASCLPDSAAVLDVESGRAPAMAMGIPASSVQLVQAKGAGSMWAAGPKGVAAATAATAAAAAPVPEVMMPGCESCGSSFGSSVCDCCGGGDIASDLHIPKEEIPELVAVLQADHHATDLARMGLLTGLAVALHNLPEGLATFVATLASPSAGVAIAVAIALHNIPEGVVVAMPIYYATKSKWKGFFWSFLSGVAEPVGGLIAYAILASNGMSPLAFAVMFGFVAGMMVYISVRELLPTALRYDPEDKFVSAACIWGMAVMAASLLLFKA